MKTLLILGAAALLGLSGLHTLGPGHHDAIVQHLHGSHESHGSHDAFSELIEALELTPAQRLRLDRIHASMGEMHRGGGTIGALHETMLGQARAGTFDATALRQRVDAHLEGVRVRAYQLSDEVVALVESFDLRQRRIFEEHLQQLAG